MRPRLAVGFRRFPSPEAELQPSRHSRESGNPVFSPDADWTPAFAGVTRGWVGFHRTSGARGPVGPHSGDLP